MNDSVKVNGEGLLMSVSEGKNFIVGSLKVAQSASYSDAVAVNVTNYATKTDDNHINNDPTNPSNNAFSDVSSGAYYAPYVQWTADQKITSGVGKNKLLPNNGITQEEIAVMVNVYIHGQGININSVAKPAFREGARTSSWAIKRSHNV